MSDYEKIKLIVADMDGTLLDDHKELDTAIVGVVKKLNMRGIHFTLASGRNIHIMKPYLEQLPISLPFITNNGANIFQNDTCIYEKNMEAKELYYAFQVLEQHNIPYIAYSDEAVFTREEKDSIKFFLDRLRGKAPIRIVKKDTILKESIFKVVMVNEDTEGMKNIMDQINEYCINLQCVRSEDSIYTITHVNAVKGKTLEYLINLLGIKKEEVMVFGDNFNDMTMFEIAGISVAMENSQNEVKEKADYQAGSNNHNGVSAFLKKIYRI